MQNLFAAGESREVGWCKTGWVVFAPGLGGGGRGGWGGSSLERSRGGASEEEHQEYHVDDTFPDVAAIAREIEACQRSLHRSIDPVFTLSVGRHLDG